ncbi:MAG: DNA recombination protein RmuC [Lewinellaceae bacterium]|nr:DNA recombination protein RmuC [Lewinellaceae bacterium]
MKPGKKSSLKTEIAQLFQLNQQLSLDAHQLTAALKGQSKVQGDWGELQLETLLEKIRATERHAFPDAKFLSRQPGKCQATGFYHPTAAKSPHHHRCQGFPHCLRTIFQRTRPCTAGSSPEGAPGQHPPACGRFEQQRLPEPLPNQHTRLPPPICTHRGSASTRSAN